MRRADPPAAGKAAYFFAEMDRPLEIDAITVFPEAFRGFLSESIPARAARAGLVRIRTVDLRDFAEDRRRTVDDRPYGGGPGMLMKPEPWFRAVEAVRRPDSRVILLGPAGRVFNQSIAEELSGAGHIVFMCGHYEGFDERVRVLATDEMSIGDFVLSGGEVAAAAMADAIVRLLPGALGGGAEASQQESFGRDGILEAPQYTRPPVFRGMRVPETLVSGDHAKTAQWRKRQAFDLTARRRPDLLEKGGTYCAGPGM